MLFFFSVDIFKVGRDCKTNFTNVTSYNAREDVLFSASAFRELYECSGGGIKFEAWGPTQHWCQETDAWYSDDVYGY